MIPKGRIYNVSEVLEFIQTWLDEAGITALLSGGISSKVGKYLIGRNVKPRALGFLLCKCKPSH